MTLPDPVEVKQEDREAAADYWARHAGTRTEFSRKVAKGESDGHGLVEAFFRHRLSAERAAIERAAEVADERFSDDGWNGHYKDAGLSIASAIRNLLEGTA